MHDPVSTLSSVSRHPSHTEPPFVFPPGTPPSALCVCAPVAERPSGLPRVLRVRVRSPLHGPPPPSQTKPLARVTTGPSSAAAATPSSFPRLSTPPTQHRQHSTGIHMHFAHPPSRLSPPPGSAMQEVPYNSARDSPTHASAGGSSTGTPAKRKGEDRVPKRGYRACVSCGRA